MSDLWCEVDLDAVKHNYRQIISKLSVGSTLMAVVKADAYGLGAVEVSKVLQDEGCNSFAVTTIAEAIGLRQEGILDRILVLGPSSQIDWEEAIQKGIELTVSQLSWIPVLEEISAKCCLKAKIHLKLETGMGRTGFTFQELAALADALQNSPSIEVVGAYSHFARGAQREHSYTRMQHQKYILFIKVLEDYGIRIPIKHISNSAAFLDFPEYHHDMVRVGTLIGGHFPSTAFEGKLDLHDPWSAKAKVVHLQRVSKGTYVGYQGLYRSKKETTLAVIPIGYTDGFGVEPKLVPQGWVDLIKIIIKSIAAFFRIQLGRERLLLKGKAVNVAGKIGMQLTVVDVGNLECNLGDEILVPLRRTLANPRIPRLYKKDGEIVRKRIIKEGFQLSNTEYSNLKISP